MTDFNSHFGSLTLDNRSKGLWESRWRPDYVEEHASIFHLFSDRRIQVCVGPNSTAYPVTLTFLYRCSTKLGERVKESLRGEDVGWLPNDDDAAFAVALEWTGGYMSNAAYRVPLPMAKESSLVPEACFRVYQFALEYDMCDLQNATVDRLCDFLRSGVTPAYAVEMLKASSTLERQAPLRTLFVNLAASLVLKGPSRLATWDFAQFETNVDTLTLVDLIKVMSKQNVIMTSDEIIESALETCEYHVHRLGAKCPLRTSSSVAQIAQIRQLDRKPATVGFARGSSPAEEIPRSFNGPPHITEWSRSTKRVDY
ncbi:MAG: hypothetical protein M1825_002473 [Sarcosagium campestre]|nr:MAG: hypothetical protein M1825_002473 [Sarcosagium campestre]